MNCLTLSAFLAILIALPEQPASKVPIGKDGLMDYESVLNDRLSKGITPGTNANVLIVKALGPKPEGQLLPPAYFKRLGIDPLPEKGDYFVGINEFVMSQGKRFQKLDTLDEQLLHVTQRPWRAREYPHIAAWLEANEEPLVLVISGTKRPNYYNPPISQQTEADSRSLFNASYPGVLRSRELGAALTARAMLRVADHKYDKAWQDLLACHRLAHVVGGGATLMEGIVGIALHKIATRSSLAYLASIELPSRSFTTCVKDLQSLSAFPSMVDKVDIAERCYYLDWLQHIRRGCNTLGRKDRKPTAGELAALAKIDWDLATRRGNVLYDRVVETLRLPSRSARSKAFDDLENELRSQERKTAKQLRDLKDLLKDSEHDFFGSPTGNLLIGSLSPAIRKTLDLHDRTSQAERNLLVAFGLAAYRSDVGRYPAKLGDLTPKYLDKIPDDLFAGKPLVYKPTEKGYLLYSVGPDGKDGGGRTRDDDPLGDDLAVRMPLPPLKAKE